MWGPSKLPPDYHQKQETHHKARSLPQPWNLITLMHLDIALHERERKYASKKGIDHASEATNYSISRSLWSMCHSSASSQLVCCRGCPAHAQSPWRSQLDDREHVLTWTKLWGAERGSSREHAKISWIQRGTNICSPACIGV